MSNKESFSIVYCIFIGHLRHCLWFHCAVHGKGQRKPFVCRWNLRNATKYEDREPRKPMNSQGCCGTLPDPNCATLLYPLTLAITWQFIRSFEWKQSPSPPELQPDIAEIDELATPRPPPRETRNAFAVLQSCEPNCLKSLDARLNVCAYCESRLWTRP